MFGVPSMPDSNHRMIGVLKCRQLNDGKLEMDLLGDGLSFKGVVSENMEGVNVLFEKNIGEKDLQELGYSSFDELMIELMKLDSIVDVGLILKASRVGEINSIFVLEQPTPYNFEVNLCDGRLSSEAYPDGTHRFTIFDKFGQEIAEGSIQESMLSTYVEGVIFDNVYKFLEYMTGLKTDLVIELLDAERIQEM